MSTRARQSLVAARDLARLGHHRDAVSRAYYAVFYAARRAVQDAGSTAGTHRGVASEFGRLLVQTGRVAAEVGPILRRLLAARLEADYDDGDSLTPADVARWVAEATAFVQAVEGTGPSEEPWRTLTADQKRDLVAQLTREMDEASADREFERAAELRDSVAQIEADLAA